MRPRPLGSIPAFGLAARDRGALCAGSFLKLLRLFPVSHTDEVILDAALHFNGPESEIILLISTAAEDCRKSAGNVC